MESPPDTTELFFDEQKKIAFRYGIATGILAIITLSLFLAHIDIFLLSLVGLVGTGWKLLFHGSTAISMILHGRRRLLFQIFISIVTPILFSIYFIKEAQSITLEGMYVYMFHAWMLVPIGIFAYVSFIVTNYLDRYHPFRGFIIASTIFFVLCLIGHHGIRIGSDDDAYGYSNSGGIEVIIDEARENQVEATKDGEKQINPTTNDISESQEINVEGDNGQLVETLLSPEQIKIFLKLSSEDKKAAVTMLKEQQAVLKEQHRKQMGLPSKYDSHIERVKNGYFLYMYIIYVVTSYTFMFLGVFWDRRSIKREQKRYKEILDAIYSSIKIVSDYGAVLEKSSKEGLIFMPESRLPHSKEKIKNAIGCVELFIEKAFYDEGLKKNFFLHPAAVLFGENGAEYIFSEKYRESLKTGLAFLVMFVSDELVEKEKNTRKVADYMKEKDIKPTDNLTAEEWEDIRKVIKEAYKL